MGLNDYKISGTDITGHGVQSAPDKLTGTAAENKAVFDRLISEIVKARLNGLIDELLGSGGASGIGLASVPGLTGAETVQEALESIEQQLQEMTQGAVADASITAAKLAPGAVTAEKLASGAVTGDKLASGAVSTRYTAQIGTVWTGSEAPYTQEIAVSGITATDRPIVDLLPSDTWSTAETQIEEYGYIYRIETGAGKITVYAAEPTTVAMDIQMEVLR